ncbi:hypothetical protein BD626DRAFT_84414 [Schizophyllum amplum]|uniref:Uncharacterized protein n=1 Tax=Schizophyllum amplum TaxID=97359 RepID=A0A550C8Z0_9AGAR|nr:hypothetical protein BD626DRAFT_84414 [Auriculariopsis ampla]
MAGDGGKKRGKEKATAGGTSDREHTPTRAEQKSTDRDMTATPKQRTSVHRPAKNRARTVRRAGIAACLITGAIFPGHGIHCAHGVPRSLEWTHPELFELFRDSVGFIILENGEKVRVLNLDTTANMELFMAWVHALFDGKSVTTQIGLGSFALVPVDLNPCLKRIKENPRTPYPDLFDQPYYEYEMRVFGSGESTIIPRHGSARRTYAHLSDVAAASADAKREGYEDAKLVAISGERKDDKKDWKLRAGDVPERYRVPPAGHDSHTSFLLRPDVPDLKFRLLSHFNPVFMIHDFAMKFRTRMRDPKLKKDLTPEEVRFFNGTLYPAVQHWFEPTEDAEEEVQEELPVLDNGQRSYSLRSKSKVGKKAKSDNPTKSKPMARLPKRFAKSSVPVGPSRAPPPPPDDVSDPLCARPAADQARTPEGARKLRNRTVPAASTSSKRTRTQASIADDDPPPPKKRARKVDTQA